MRISIPGLGGRLRRARNGTGLSQEAVAERIGISWMTVHRWERSQRAVPDYLLDKLCDLYDKPIRWNKRTEEQTAMAACLKVLQRTTARVERAQMPPDESIERSRMHLPTTYR